MDVYAPLLIPLCGRVTRRQIVEWNRRTPAERLAGTHYSRAKKLNNGRPNGYWSARQWLALVAACGSHCYWCGCYTNQPSPDRRVPLARGGKNCITNLVVSCRRCQSRRRDRTEVEYLEWLAAHDWDQDHDQAA